MSSDLFRQHLSSADISMLNGVLQNAGMNLDDEARQAVRRRAARFLIAQFQRGNSSPAALLEKLTLAKFADRAASQLAQVGSLAGSRTGPPSRPASRISLYDKRHDDDKTWAVIEIATGKTARYGSWIMRGLSVKSADRVLRTLNAGS